MAELDRMSPEMMPLSPSVGLFMPHCNQEEPRDLSIKRKLRPVPPPLDLSKRNLEPDQQLTDLTSPKSPLAQKNLPLRKRAYSWSSQPENLGFQLAPGSTPSSVIRSTTEIRSPSNQNCLTSANCSSSSLKISGLPTPHTPHTPHPHSAIPVITSRFNFGENINVPGNGSSRFGYSNQGPLNLSIASVGTLPSSLLSPAPSHPSSSSLNSSREELEPDTMNSDIQMTSPSQASPQLPVCANVQRLNMNHHSGMEHSGEGALSSVAPSFIPPSPNNSHQWPTSVWSVFLAGVQVHFVLGGGQITGARLSEELGRLERSHYQQYAPHGLHLLKTIYEEQSYNGPNSQGSYCQLYFRPVGVQQEDIMVIAPPDHPFYVHSKGWCSLLVDQATERYNVPCQQLQEGDICLPPYHPETTHIPIPVVTPDLTEAMKRFDFNDDNYEVSYQGSCSAPPSATFPPQTHRSVFLSPPASPSKKTSKNLIITTPHPGESNGVVGAGGGTGMCLKSRRPMNGFMLFAKHHRLKLIQQYPGKDNRAISVLLGAMWKALPDEDRDRINSEARVQAEERKRIDPDCWKRKRSHSTS